MVRKTYKYRIYPTNEQKVFFAKCFGCVRFFYNKSLSDINEEYRNTGKFKNITPAFYKKEYPFLKEVDSLALCNAQLNRNAAFKNFFNHKSNFPKYKSKRNEQSYTTNIQSCARISDDKRYISIPKCKKIRIKMHRFFQGTLKSITISMTSDDKYYASLLVEEESKLLVPCKNVIGLDLGIKNLIVDSNGKKYENHKYLAKSIKKLARAQKKFSLMIKGSNNSNKQRIKISKLYKRVNNQRNDYLHKLSKQIIDENQVICIEDLKVTEMMVKKELARSLSDASFSTLVFMLTYKAAWYGRKVIKIPRYYESSQLCSSCGYKNSTIKDLSIRKWTCPICGSIHDRDINAAKNILSKGIEMLTKDGTHPDSLFMLDSKESSSKKPPLF